MSPSTTSIFIFLSVEKLVDLPAHLLSEDQQGTLPALVKNALAVSLEQLVERSRSELPLGFDQNRTMPDFSRKKTPA